MNNKIFFIAFVFLFSLGFALAQEEVGSFNGEFQVGSEGGQIIFNGPGGAPYCGNGIIESGEQCDGGDLGGASCSSLGYDTGSLACHAGSCTFDTAGCSNSPSGSSGSGSGGGGSSSSGSGGGGTPTEIDNSVTCVENWVCQDWSECNDEKQIRECNDLNGCETFVNRPESVRDCGGLSTTIDGESANGGPFSAITGAVIGIDGGPTWFGGVLAVLFIFGIYYLIVSSNAGAAVGSVPPHQA